MRQIAEATTVDAPEMAERLALRDRVLVIVEAFLGGTIDHWDVRRQCTARERWEATRLTPPDHPLFGPLMVLLDELIATDPTGEHGYLYQTKHGIFSEAEIAEVGGQTVMHDGRVLVRFPARVTVLGPVFAERRMA